MSVIVKGINLPASCYDCNFWVSEEAYCTASFYDVSLSEATSGRQDFCPLISVPPHGRLIDADALAETHRTMAYENGGRSYPFHTLAKSWVQDAPTIIEEGE